MGKKCAHPDLLQLVALALLFSVPTSIVSRRHIWLVQELPSYRERVIYMSISQNLFGIVSEFSRICSLFIPMPQANLDLPFSLCVPLISTSQSLSNRTVPIKKMCELIRIIKVCQAAPRPSNHKRNVARESKWNTYFSSCQLERDLIDPRDYEWDPHRLNHDGLAQPAREGTIKELTERPSQFIANVECHPLYETKFYFLWFKKNNLQIRNSISTIDLTDFRFRFSFVARCSPSFYHTIM